MDTEKLSLNTTISHLKLLIYQFCHLAIWNQTIVFNGQKIEDNSRNLLQCGIIQNHSHIIVLRNNRSTIKHFKNERAALQFSDSFVNLNNPVLTPMTYHEIINLEKNQFIYFRGKNSCLFKDAIVRHVERNEWISVQFIDNMNLNINGKKEHNEFVTIDLQNDKRALNRCFGKPATTTMHENVKQKYKTIPKRDHLLICLMVNMKIPRDLAEIIVDYADGFVFHLQIDTTDVSRNNNNNNNGRGYDYSDWSSVILSHALSLKENNVFSIKSCDGGKVAMADSVKIEFKFGIVCLSKKNSLPIESYFTPFKLCPNLLDIFCKRKDSKTYRNNNNRNWYCIEGIRTHFITVVRHGNVVNSGICVSSQGNINTEKWSNDAVDIVDDVINNQVPIVIKFNQSKNHAFEHQILFEIGNYTITNSRAVVDCSKYECYLALSGPYATDSQINKLDFVIDRVE